MENVTEMKALLLLPPVPTVCTQVFLDSPSGKQQIPERLLQSLLM